jgi:hypothetical protein
MTRVKKIEFWLFALPALLVGSAWLASFDRVTFARHFIPIFAVAWMILAIAWMFRELVRWIRD